MRGWNARADFLSTSQRVAALAFAALAVSSILVASVAAQAEVVKDCVDCDLKATLVLQIGTIDGPGALGAPARIAHRLNGQWVVTDYQQTSRLTVFGPDGEWVRSVGRRGQGPGEYDLALWVSVTEGDSLRVADLGQSRITTLTPALAPLRTQLMGRGFHEIVFLEDTLGRYVISARGTTRADVGLPIHLVAADGSVLRSFGSESASEDTQNTLEFWRNIAGTRNGELWSSKVTSYELERWSLETGERLQFLERVADWFPPHSGYGRGFLDSDQEPAPGLIEIYADSTGVLWTGSHVADAHWRAAFEKGEDHYGSPAQRVYDISRYYDTIIEAISTVGRRVLGRARLEGNILNFVGEGIVATSLLEPPGYPVIRIWKIELPDDPGGKP